MSTLAFIPAGLQSPELEIMLSRAQQAIDRGERTIVVGCEGGPGYACSFNIYGIGPICHVCTLQKKAGLKKLQGNYTYIACPPKAKSPYTLSSVSLPDRWAVKALVHDNVDIGQAAYSSYVGQTRDRDLEGVLARWSIRKLLSTSAILASFFLDLLKQEQVTQAVLYNGRHNQSRPLLRITKQLGIQTEIMEFAGQDARCVYEFHNCLPQDLNNLARLIDSAWERFQGDREAAAQSYFESLRGGRAVNDRSYVLGQTTGLLPQGWSKEKRNIVIYNSSEDEFAALGGEYDESLYPDQSQAISRICESLADDKGVQIYLRMHPNLRSVKWKFAMALRALGGKYPNVIIVPPESPASTYTLLAACDVVVSFGSTIGIEAAYWDKPSILLGRCIYESSGSVYVPRSHDELIALLRQKSLPSLLSLGAKKVGLFWMAAGNGLKYFGGTRRDGFLFAGQHIRMRGWERFVYVVSKILDRWLFGVFANYLLSRWQRKRAS